MFGEDGEEFRVVEGVAQGDEVFGVGAGEVPEFFLVVGGGLVDDVGDEGWVGGVGDHGGEGLEEGGDEGLVLGDGGVVREGHGSAEVGFDEAGLDELDADTDGAEFVEESFGDAFDGEFGAAIGCAGGEGEKAGDRRDVDDGSTLQLAEVGEDGFCGGE